MLSKLKYGFSRLKDELTNKEDYWHIRFYARPFNKDEVFDKYYLDISKKADYPFQLDNLIPLVAINGVKLHLPVTILNYGLGWLDKETTDEKVITAIFNWLKSNQTENGEWLQYFDDSTYQLKSGWVSGMTQGLAISFLIRAIKKDLIPKEEADKLIEAAYAAMLSNSCITNTSCGRFIEEYGGSNSHVLNGYVFSVYGLLDYAHYTGKFEPYNEFEATLHCMIDKYNYNGWTYYDRQNLIASRLYHNLHLEMMKSMYAITQKEKYQKFFLKWRRGDKWYFIFVFLKAFQKFAGISKLDTLDK